MKHILSSTALGLSLFAIAPVFAAEGYITGDASLRAGPDTSYPRVSMLSAGTPVAIMGCVDGWSWCDVSVGDDRGWVAGNFLQEEYRGQRVYVTGYGAQIGIPIVAFVFGTYWGEHYRNRSWYGEREHWSHFRPQYRSLTVDGGQGRRPQGNSYSGPHGANTGNAHAVSPHDNRGRTDVMPTQPAQRINPSAAGQYHEAKSVHGAPGTVTRQEAATTHQSPTQHVPAQTRAAAQQRAKAKPKSPPKVVPEKSPQKHESDKDKDKQH